jgi:hypothetical protein
MATSVNDLTVQWEEDGTLKVRELDKHVLSDGPWATVMFRFEESDRQGGFRAPKVSIRRYQKKRGGYVFHSKFTVSSDEQGREIARVLDEWCNEGQ